MTTLPRFLCVGAQKAGTSWLFQQVRQHPDVWVPPLKELHFFNHLFVPENRVWTKGHLRTVVGREIERHMKQSNFTDFHYVSYLSRIAYEEVFSEGWYRHIYNFYGIGTRCTGDITPEYCTVPGAGIRYLQGLLGGPKIIFLVRDPVSRATSQIKMNLDRKDIKSPTYEDWMNEAGSWDVCNRGDYQSYIPRWLSHVPEKDILFVPYKKIAHAPYEVLRQVERFIGVSEFSNYKAVEKRVYEGSKREVPGAVKAALEGKFGDQRDAVAKYLGKEFLAQC